KWINQFGSLEELLQRQDEVGGKVGESLREFAHLAERNRRLNHLVRDVELDLTLDECKRGEIDMAAVQEVFTKLEFRTLLQRVGKLAGVDPSQAGDAGKSASTSSGAPTPRFPEPTLLLDEELGEWLSKADTPAVHFVQGHSGIEVGLATADSTIELQWQP